jgi:hypothetical protein
MPAVYCKHHTRAGGKRKLPFSYSEHLASLIGPIEVLKIGLSSLNKVLYSPDASQFHPTLAPSFLSNLSASGGLSSYCGGGKRRLRSRTRPKKGGALMVRVRCVKLRSTFTVSLWLVSLAR